MTHDARARVHINRDRNKWLRVCSMFEAKLSTEKKNLNKLSNAADVGLTSTPKASANLRLNPVLGTKSQCPLVAFTLVTS